LGSGITDTDTFGVSLGILLQTIINGIMLGSIYALVALGLTLIYGILKIPDFAHGALYMVRPYFSFLVITSLLVEQKASIRLTTADRGYIMETGRITLAGRAQDLLQDEKVKRAYPGL